MNDNEIKKFKSKLNRAFKIMRNSGILAVQNIGKDYEDARFILEERIRKANGYITKQMNRHCFGSCYFPKKEMDTQLRKAKARKKIGFILLLGYDTYDINCVEGAYLIAYAVCGILEDCDIRHDWDRSVLSKIEVLIE